MDKDPVAGSAKQVRRGPMNAKLALIITLSLAIVSAAAASPDVKAINDAQWTLGVERDKNLQHVLIKAQIMLGRARFSPGEIDGKLGDNFKKALSAFAIESGLPDTSELNADVWQKLEVISADPVLKEYTISEADVRGPFVEKLPAKMEEMKELPALAYRNPREKIAEKFHMSEELLTALNPERNFNQAAEKVFVVDLGRTLSARSSHALR
jgi:hypothetical protein